MAPRKIDIAPELAAEGKRLYERTQTPLRDIAAMMGVCRRTLENRIREWNWTRRKAATRPIDLRHAMRGAVISAVTQEGAGEGVCLAPLSAQQRMAMVLQINEAIEHNIAAVRRVLDKVDPLKPEDVQGSAHSLAMTAQTLRELAALIQPDPVTPPTNETEYDPLPRDIDDFREEIARRIRGLIDAERASAGEGALRPSDPPAAE